MVYFGCLKREISAIFLKNENLLLFIEGINILRIIIRYNRVRREINNTVIMIFDLIHKNNVILILG